MTQHDRTDEPAPNPHLDLLLAGLVATPNGCLEWQGKNGKGYGHFTFDGAPYMTHRIAWELVNGPIPGRLIACHKCDNPPCCNPVHIFPGTNSENMLDRYAKGRHRVGKDAAITTMDAADADEGLRQLIHGNTHRIQHCSSSKRLMYTLDHTRKHVLLAYHQNIRRLDESDLLELLAAVRGEINGVHVQRLLPPKPLASS